MILNIQIEQIKYRNNKKSKQLQQFNKQPRICLH